MKIFISFLIVLSLLCGALAVASFAADEVTVYVTVCTDSLRLAQEPIKVTDADGDGELTINDALYLAHEAKFDGGAAAGYANATGDYGLYITKLWGTENGGSYGYYVNNVSASGLADKVSNGDYLNAFAYTDLTGFSDAYCYFDSFSASAEQGTELSLTLSRIGYDENWNTVVLAVAGAELTLNGESTGVKTDENGKATISAPDAGTYIVSAKSDTLTLVPPVCTLTSTAKQTPATSDCRLPAFFLLAAAVSAAALTVFKRRRLSL